MNAKCIVRNVSVCDHEDAHSNSRKWWLVGLGSGPGSPLRTGARDQPGLTLYRSWLSSSESDWMPGQPAGPPPTPPLRPVTTLRWVTGPQRGEHQGRYCLSPSLKSFSEEWDFLIFLHYTENKVHQTFHWWRNQEELLKDPDWASCRKTASKLCAEPARLWARCRLLFCRARMGRPRVVQSQSVPASWTCPFCVFSNKTTLRASYELSTVLGIEDRVLSYAMILFFCKSSSK